MAVDKEFASMAQEKTLLVFSLLGESFAIDVDRVMEITKCSELTGIDGSPEYVLGMMEERNLKIPVFSLKKLLFLNSTDDDSNRVMVVNIKGRIIALTIETQTDLDTLSLSAGEEVVEIEGRYHGWVDGEVCTEGGTVFILALSGLFSSSDKTESFKDEQ